MGSTFWLCVFLSMSLLVFGRPYNDPGRSRGNGRRGTLWAHVLPHMFYAMHVLAGIGLTSFPGSLSLRSQEFLEEGRERPWERGWYWPTIRLGEKLSFIK